MRDVVGYEGLYSVTEDGQVWGRKRYKFIKQRISTTGYFFTQLCKDGKVKQVATHRIVALAYIANPLNKPQVNHKNGIKTDNRVENLEWCTREENWKHARESGLLEICKFKKERQLSSKKKAEIIKKYKKGESMRQLSEEFCVHASTISCIVTGRRWGAKKRTPVC